MNSWGGEFTKRGAHLRQIDRVEDGDGGLNGGSWDGGSAGNPYLFGELAGPSSYYASPSIQKRCTRMVLPVLWVSSTLETVKWKRPKGSSAHICLMLIRVRVLSGPMFCFL